jgi:ABC-type phosphate transport system ATPase subunit
MGELVEQGPTARIFDRPEQALTHSYLKGEIG